MVGRFNDLHHALKNACLPYYACSTLVFSSIHVVPIVRDVFLLCFISSSRAFPGRLQLSSVKYLAPSPLQLRTIKYLAQSLYINTVATRAGPKLAGTPFHSSNPLSKVGQNIWMTDCYLLAQSCDTLSLNRDLFCYYLLSDQLSNFSQFTEDYGEHSSLRSGHDGSW